MKKPVLSNPVLRNPVSNHLAKVICLLSLLAILAACTFRQPETTHVSSLHEDTTGCLANQQQVLLRDCLTAVYHTRLVNAYTLDQLR
jgi:ABC-type uncharacterized transport system auxiliary subunit